ncbi:methylcrotonoyl-CoA carboxylase [Balamuthia mandrillaris]
MAVPRFKSKLNPNSPEFQKNYAEMQQVVAQLHERLHESLGQGEQRHIERHLRRGQLLGRDRLELLLDQDSPFLELMPLAGWGQDNMTLGGSIVAGIGLVCGVECLVSASVATMKGGAMNKVSAQKSLRLHEIAMQNRLPSISLIESAGADLTQQDEVFHSGGRTFRDLARRSKAGLPTMSIVFGSSTAGGAYNPGMSDYTVMVKDQAKVFLGGPPLVKMATGEVVDEESLGGADMHSKLSGVSDYLAIDELDAIRKAREIIHNLHWEKATPLPKTHLLPSIEGRRTAEGIIGEVEEPWYDPEELLGVVSPNIRVPLDVREIIARVVDGSRISEFKPLYGSTLVTCFARIHGFPVGILASNGVLFSESACKGTQFIDLCNQRSTPLIFMHNITGFMVGKKYEEGGIIKHGSKFINAVSNSGVPHISLILGASYGAGNYGMCGRAYNPRFLFSWPHSKCSVMGPEQLTGVMDIVQREAARKSGRTLDEEVAQRRKEMFAKLVEEQSDAYYTSSRLIDDGIIDPRDTRTVLGFCLSVIYSAEVKGDNHGGVSRM